ncbi:MAG: tRNA 2-thiouridine(34) synthase MnmA [Ruminococcaceae bacterium]|nr:tRNA 2-thiouridine(34) synthase MnmA [Oscillospiraceae bacterium]
MANIIAMSGGVDSSVSLLLSKEKLKNEPLIGVTLALAAENTPEHAADLSNISDAAAVCASQGIEHRAVFAHAEFKQAVIDYFTGEYMAGRTPNPCVVCNRDIKFGLLGDYAKENGAGRIITGHYARLAEIGGYTYIKKAADISKDQSYMLAYLSQNQLRRAYFPLGELTKAEVRAIAEDNNLVSARKKDSQDICFVPDGDYVAAITKATGKEPISGNYIDQSGKILGSHRGYWCYTVGQRKGLGISLGKHAFVLSKDASTNTVVLGDEADLFKTQVNISSLNLPSDPHALDGDVRCIVKLRYAHRGSECVLHRTSETTATLEFDEPQRAPTPGQFAVIYDADTGEHVLGAGVIE